MPVISSGEGEAKLDLPDTFGSEKQRASDLQALIAYIVFIVIVSSCSPFVCVKVKSILSVCWFLFLLLLLGFVVVCFGGVVCFIVLATVKILKVFRNVNMVLVLTHPGFRM